MLGIWSSPSYNMRYSHLKIVHDDGKMEKRSVQVFGDDKIADIVRLRGNLASYQVLENNLFILVFKSYRLAVQISLALVQKFLQIFL